MGRFSDTDLPWGIYLNLWWTSRVLREYCTEVQRMLVESALRRGDVERADQMLVDWHVAESRHVVISKWDPGSHYYVLDNKYDTRELAEARGRALGFTSFTLRIVKIDGTK